MKFNKSSGQVSRLLLVLAIIVLVAVVITYLVLRMASPAPKPASQNKTATTVPLPVYEKQLENIDFTFESALNRGNVLSASDVTSAQDSSYQKDLNTTERFIQVTVGAQNVGKENIEQNAWDIENIVDSKGREFIPDDTYTVAPWIPADSNCGALLRPAFDPTPCTKIYEVSNQSDLGSLKIRVETGQGNVANNLSSGKADSFLIDLIVK